MDKLGLEIMFADHPVRKKKAFLDEKKYIDFTQWTYLDCFTGLTYDSVQKLEKFYLSSILDKWALKLCLMIIQVENKPS